MKDIGNELIRIIEDRQCSPVYALVLLSKEGEEDGIREFQSQSKKKTCGGLCDSCHCKNNGQRLGRCVS